MAIFSALIGFIGGFVPEIIKLFKDKQDKKHELAVMDKQMEATKLAASAHLEEVKEQGDVAETVALYKASETKLTGYKWLDGVIEFYNSGVRPTITYLVIALYAANKFEVGQQEYTEFDQSTLMLVLGYWFGSRSAKKFFIDRNK